MSQAKPLALRAYAKTDIGNIRKNNEDNFLLLPDHRCFAVSDGMGGANAGEIASAMTVDSLGEQVSSDEQPLALYNPEDPETTGDEVLTWMAAAIRRTHLQIYHRAQSEPDKRGMGCTLDVMMLASDRAFVGHVGDSRIYLVRRGRVYRVTQDHTWAQAQFSAGIITEEELKTSRNRNVLLKAMGVTSQLDPDIFTFSVHPGDRFLMCSDGLSEYVTDAEIGTAFENHPLEKLPDYFIKTACERGGHDNITALVIELENRLPVGAPEPADFLLAGLAFASQLSEAELRIFCKHTRVARYEAGTNLVLQEEDTEQLCWVVEGEIAEEGETSRRLASTGDFVGAGALWSKRTATASIVAVTESIVCSFDNEMLAALQKENPTLSKNLLFALLQLRAERVQHRLAGHSYRPALEALSRTL